MVPNVCLDVVGRGYTVAPIKVQDLAGEGWLLKYEGSRNFRATISVRNGVLTVMNWGGIDYFNVVYEGVTVLEGLGGLGAYRLKGAQVTVPAMSMTPSTSKPVVQRATQKPEDWVKGPLKVGIFCPSWDEHCGVAEHTRYFVEKLKCPYTILDLHGSDLYRTVMHEHVNILHIQHEFAIVGGDLATLLGRVKNAGVKVVLDIHSFTKNFPNELLQLADKVIVHNPEAKLGDKAVLVPLATPIPANMDKREARVRFGVMGDPVIASFGFINRNKGLDETLEAVARLKGEFPQICFLMVGSLHPKNRDLGYINHLHIQAKNLGLPVFWKEEFYPIETVHQLLSCADLTCLYYKNVSILSGSGPARICLSAHRPLIVSDIATFREFGDATYCVKEGDVTTLAEAMKRVLKDEALQHTFVERGDRYLAGISGEAIARRFEQIYDELHKA